MRQYAGARGLGVDVATSVARRNSSDNDGFNNVQGFHSW
jgi:hypothetical protein